MQTKFCQVDRTAAKVEQSLYKSDVGISVASAREWNSGDIRGFDSSFWLHDHWKCYYFPIDTA